MIGAPDAASFERLLWHEVTLSGAPVVTTPAGKTESVTTYPNKMANSKANVQAMSGRERLMGIGLEASPTHRIWLKRDAVCDVSHVIKCTAGPFTGNYYHVLFIEKFDHHIEATCRIDVDLKTADPL